MTRPKFSSLYWSCEGCGKGFNNNAVQGSSVQRFKVRLGQASRNRPVQKLNVQKFKGSG